MSFQYTRHTNQLAIAIMVQSNKKDGGGGGTSRHHAAAVAGAGGSGASGTTHGGREREDMVANIHEFVNDPVGEINGTQYHVSC